MAPLNIGMSLVLFLPIFFFEASAIISCKYLYLSSIASGGTVSFNNLSIQQLYPFQLAFFIFHVEVAILRIVSLIFIFIVIS
uniref:Putative product n=1 Tax=Xenopsylla cheopis TaxID=163159 RepID=A0A6M2DVU5_XENCH